MTDKVNELTKIISPGFTKKTVLDMLWTKSGFLELTILDIVIETDESKKGDSYLSTICRFTVKANGKNKSGILQEFTLPIIVKFIPKNVPRQKTFRSADFFKTEIYFYEKVWPEMKKFKFSKLPNEPDEIPILLAFYCDGKNDFIALEDLSYQGFKPSSRSDVVTKEKLLLFLKVLANFHALGIVMKLQNPEFETTAKSLPESYFADKFRPWYENFMYKSMGVQYQKAAKELLSLEYYEKVSKLFSGDFYAEHTVAARGLKNGEELGIVRVLKEALTKNPCNKPSILSSSVQRLNGVSNKLQTISLIGQIIQGCKVHDKLSTVTEGDAWWLNFLAHTDNDGNNTRAVLIDFQLARYAPIVNDLFHFILSSVPEKMLNEWDSLIAGYHTYLSNRIELLGGDKNLITLKEIYEEFIRYPFVGVAMGMESLLMSLLAEKEVADLDTLEGEDVYPLEVVWLLPEFDKNRQERLAFLVKQCVDKGFIA